MADIFPSKKVKIEEKRNQPLSGLFALVQAVNAIEAREKTLIPRRMSEDYTSKSQVLLKCGNIYCNSETRSPAEEGWSRRKINDSYLQLCKKCTTAYGMKQYCTYCKQIYTDNGEHNTILDGMAWIQCGTCKRWIHMKCEEKFGNADIEVLVLDPLFIYECTECRKAACCGKKYAKKQSAL